MKPGDLVTWRYVPPGGLGYVLRIPGTVVTVTRTRVKISVMTHSVGGNEWVKRWVKIENVVPWERKSTN